MSLQKRALALASAQPSQPLRPRFSPTEEERNRRSWFPEEAIRRVVREEVERARSDLAECCQSGNAFKEIAQQIHSMENASKKLKEALELASSQSTQLGRAYAKSMPKNDGRNLQLQFQTKLTLPLFTGCKIQGDKGDSIYVALVDANRGNVITSGPESSIKLDVVVLDGAFNKDDEDDWAQEEFENYVVKTRNRARPLLTGDLQVTLKGGVGELGELLFTDNSSWLRSKRFMIGLKVASGYNGSTRIREAKTKSFIVKDHIVESYKKHYPPASNDEVWRLEKIAKDGCFHRKLNEARIHNVGEFLLQLFMDSNKLREIFGRSISLKTWDVIVHHATSCTTNWKLYWYHPDGMRKVCAVFNTDGQLIGLIKEGQCFSTHQLSAKEKEHGDAIVKKAFDNWNDVREFNAENLPGSMQKESSSSFPSQVTERHNENRIPVQTILAPQICSASVGLEALIPANAGSTAGGTCFRTETRLSL